MLPLLTLAWHTLSVLIPCLPYEIEFLYPHRPLEIEFRRHRYHRELQQPNLFTSIDRTARISAQECRRYITQDPLPPFNFFLHASYTFFFSPKIENQPHPQQSTAKHHLSRQYNIIKTIMYVCTSFQYKFILFVRCRRRRSLDWGRRRSVAGQVDLDCSYRHDNSMHLHRNIKSSCSRYGNSNRISF